MCLHACECVCMCMCVMRKHERICVEQVACNQIVLVRDILWYLLKIVSLRECVCVCGGNVCSVCVCLWWESCCVCGV